MIKFILLSLFTSSAFAAYTPGSVVSRDYAPKITTVNTIVSKSSGYTATDKDETIVFTASATLSLPAASTVKGKKYEVIASGGSFQVTIDPNSTETVCGQTTVKLDASSTYTDSMLIQSDGSNWVGLNESCTRREAMQFTCASGGSTIGSQTGSWVSSIGTRSSNLCTVTLVSGIFSATPICFTTNNDSAGNAVYGNNAFSSTTSGGVTCISGTGTCSTDYTHKLNCVGPR